MLAGFGHAINAVMDTRWGHLINVGHLIGTLWSSLFRVHLRNTIWSGLFRVTRGEELPLWGAIGGLLVVCAVCLLLLDKKVRACEVVR